MKTDFWQNLRSVRGQVILLGVVFAGAIVVAVIVLCLRGVVFEYYAREKYQPLDDAAKETSKVLADPASTPEQVEEVGKKLEEERLKPPAKSKAIALELLYGGWMSDDALDPAGHLAQRLTRLQPNWVFRRLRVTLVAGSPPQQAQALAWLHHVAGGEHSARVAELAAYVQRKAQRRGDEDLVRQADAVLALGHPRDGGP